MPEKDTANTLQLNAVVPETCQGQRLDQVLARLFPDYSRARWQTWIKQGSVLVDGQCLRAKDKLAGGETIVVEATIEVATDWSAQNIELTVHAEDDDFLIINKPAGLVMHPATGNPDNTLVNALLHHYPELETLPRAGLIHRLDKDTSGLVIVARNLAAHHHLVKQLQARTIKRYYQAVVNGIIIAGGTVDAPMGRHPRQRMKMAVVSNGKEARTHYRVLEKFTAHTHIDVQLDTGRTHQIRVHMAHIKHPLVGDPVYAQKNRVPAGLSEELRLVLREFPRQALHAYHLEFEHPRREGELCEYEIELPADMQNLLKMLRAET